jgi:hypothetical protein
MHPTLLRFSLACAVAVPLAYFGAQVLGAAFYTGFSVLRDVASLLGSDRSTAPALFNTAVYGVALISLLAAPGLGWGVAGALRGQGTPAWRAVGSALLAAACVASFGLASAWAATYPLPDPRHNPGALGAGMFAAPFVALAIALQLKDARALRWVCAACVLGFFAVAGVYSDLIPLDRDTYNGLLQRVGALVMLVPFAVVAGRVMIRTDSSVPPRSES